MGAKLFITSTDTGSGKTYVTAGLIERLIEAGITARALKPVACGTGPDGLNEDVAMLMRAQGLNHPQSINLHTFAKPASPNIAAVAENRNIDSEALVRWCDEQSSGQEICLIEGVGGLMVPLTGKYLVVDWIHDLSPCQVMLVIGTKLGAINHALLTLAQLKHGGITPSHVVINGIEERYISDVAVSIAPFLPPDCLVSEVPFDAPDSRFAQITEQLAHLSSC